MSPRRLILIGLACAALTGCVAPPPPPDPIMGTVCEPLFTPVDGIATTTATTWGGVTISAEPMPYRIVDQIQESADSLGTRTEYDAQDDGTWAVTPVEGFRWTQAAIPVVKPDRVAFVLTVENRSSVAFRGRGSTIWFRLPGRPPLAAEGLGVAALVVPAGGRERVTVYGPRLSTLQAGAVVKLELADVPTTTDAAGGPAGRRTVTYRYAYAAAEQVTRAVPRVEVHERQAAPTEVVGVPMD